MMVTTSANRRAYCAPEVDLTQDALPQLTCLGISAHIESDEEGVVEISPTFDTIGAVVEWALARCDTVIVRIQEGPDARIYWRGPGPLPEEASALDQAQAERDFDLFAATFPRPIA